MTKQEFLEKYDKVYTKSGGKRYVFPLWRGLDFSLIWKFYYLLPN